MLTQILQWIFLGVKQNICWHSYDVVHRHDNGGSYEICNKCDYIKF